MFSAENAETEAPPQVFTTENLASDLTSEQREAYFRRLNDRISTAVQLGESAGALVEEAAYAASHGDRQSSQQLLKMAATLREMAADLLVRPML